jgi:hypothetical protein
MVRNRKIMALERQLCRVGAIGRYSMRGLHGKKRPGAILRSIKEYAEWSVRVCTRARDSGGKPQ